MLASEFTQVAYATNVSMIELRMGKICVAAKIVPDLAQSTTVPTLSQMTRKKVMNNG